VMNRPTLAYPVAVGIGAMLAAAWASLTVPSGEVRSA